MEESKYNTNNISTASQLKIIIEQIKNAEYEKLKQEWENNIYPCIKDKIDDAIANSLFKVQVKITENMKNFIKLVDENRYNTKWQEYFDIYVLINNGLIVEWKNSSESKDTVGSKFKKESLQNRKKIYLEMVELLCTYIKNKALILGSKQFINLNSKDFKSIFGTYIDLAYNDGFIDNNFSEFLKTRGFGVMKDCEFNKISWQ